MNYNFLLGLGIGMTIGCLLAPRSGSETRRYLQSKAHDGTERLRSSAGQMRERAGGIMEKGRHMMHRQKHEGTASEYNPEPIAHI